MWPQAAQSLAAAIVDWRTPGLSPSPHGAKAAEYRAAGMTYGPPGRPFENLDELGYVLGMDPALLAELKPHLTLWSTTDPNPAFADALVLGALRVAGAPPFAGMSNEARVIAITATATLPDAASVTRRAVVRFGYSPDGRGWRVLAWDDGEPEPR
jgi:general secretion pathway protein K